MHYSCIKKKVLCAQTLNFYCITCRFFPDALRNTNLNLLFPHNSVEVGVFVIYSVYRNCVLNTLLLCFIYLNSCFINWITRHHEPVSHKTLFLFKFCASESMFGLEHSWMSNFGIIWWNKWLQKTSFVYSWTISRLYAVIQEQTPLVQISFHLSYLTILNMPDFKASIQYVTVYQ